MLQPYRTLVVTSPKRVRAVVGGVAMVDSLAPRLLLRAGRLPVYYFPPGDVGSDLLAAGAEDQIEGVGRVRRWSSAAENERRPLAWSVEDPADAVGALQDHFAFDWDAVDGWYEEDEALFGHPRDPFHRIDLRQSHRVVEIDAGGERLARSTRALFAFETGLPTRYYLPREDVRMDLLQPSPKTTLCAYKGKAFYWSAWIGGRLYPDLAWSYPEPLPEKTRLTDLIAFDESVVDGVLIDGRRIGAETD